MNKTRVKTFDCVELMRNIRDRISAEIRGLTPAEEIAWLHPGNPPIPGYIVCTRRLPNQAMQPTPLRAAADRQYGEVSDDAPNRIG